MKYICTDIVPFLASGLLLAASSAHAQVSLAADDTLDDVTVRYKTASGRDISSTFTLMRDVHQVGQWYYIPATPRVSETVDAAGTVVPELSLLRYATRDANNSLQFKGGGLLQFGATLAVPTGVVDLLRAELISRKYPDGGAPEIIRLSAIPLKSAQVSFYSPSSGDLIGASPFGAGQAPVFANQKMAFAIPLSEVGTDIYEELVKGTTGVPVVVTYTFNALAPPSKFSVVVDWDQAFKHYSENTEIAASASYYGLWGGSAAYSDTKVREDLVSSKVIRIDVEQGEAVTDETINSYLQPVVKRINDELISQLAPPAKIDPAAAPKPSSKGGWFGSASYSVAKKDISIRKRGTERFDFRYAKLVERHSAASGFIGAAQYPEDVVKRLITVVDNSLWENAYLSLPPVPNTISSMDMTVRLVGSGKSYDSQFYRWTPAVGWTDGAARQVDRAVFKLLHVKGDNDGQVPKDTTFEVDQTIVVSNDTVTAHQSFPVMQDGTSVAAPSSLVDFVTIDPTALQWAALDPPSKLTRVVVTVSSGGRSTQEIFRPVVIAGTQAAPTARYWVLNKQSEPSPVAADISYRIGSETRTVHVDDVRRTQNGMTIFLEDLVPR